MAAIGEVVDSGQFILGDSVKGLRRLSPRSCGVKHTIAVANGSDALYLALLWLQMWARGMRSSLRRSRSLRLRGRL